MRDFSIRTITESENPNALNRSRLCTTAADRSCAGTDANGSNVVVAASVETSEFVTGRPFGTIRDSVPTSPVTTMVR